MSGAAESMRTCLKQFFMHTSGSGALHLCDIRGSEGELGLKASGAEDYFGAGLFIGDTSRFKRLVEDSENEN